MRLAIDYRLLASKENLVNRGIGRYTQQQLRHVLTLDTENEYVLLCPLGSDVGLVLPEITNAPNVSIQFGPVGDFNEWLRALGINLYHATAPFVLDQVEPEAFGVIPTVATVYDLIPLIFPTAYLLDDCLRAAYASAATRVGTATRLLAISEGTREDAIAYLGFPRDAVDYAPPFADPCFRPLAAELVTDRLLGLRHRIGLPERFVLTVAALHHSKNLELTFAAYARLSPGFRQSLPLVVACHLDENGMAHVRDWAEAHGTADGVILTGYVTDAELCALYNRATVVVHPSRYEGFGLPVLEAMQCGTPVVTTTAPSLPEVAGGAAVLVAPDDPVGLAAAVEGLSQDSQKRKEMGAAGLDRASAFSPETLARATLACYAKAAVRQGPRASFAKVAKRLSPNARAPSLNKLCEAEDLDDPEGLDGDDHSGVLGWSVAMSLGALRHSSVVVEGSHLLWLAMSGFESALGLLGEVKELTIAGPLLEDGGTPASRSLFVDPSLIAKAAFDPAKLIVRHTALSPLPFRDATFDGVVCRRTIHDSSPAAVADAVAEAARVLKPGGVLAWSMPVRIHGPASSPGLPLDWVVENLLAGSELEPVDPVRTEVSAATMTGTRDFSSAFCGEARNECSAPLVVCQGALLGFLHLTLRKPENQAPG